MNLQFFVDVLATGRGASYSLTHGQPTSGNFASIYGHEHTPELPSTFVRYKRDLQVEMIGNEMAKFLIQHGYERTKDNGGR